MYDVKLFPFKVESEVSDLDGAKLANVEKPWQEGFQGKGQIVAVLDTGVDFAHPDLKDNIITGKDFTGEGSCQDWYGHGTHVAGIIHQMAPNAKILPVKVLNSTGQGKREWIVQGLNYAIDWRGRNGEKVHVINMSLGSTLYTKDLEDAVKRAVDTNISIIAASGNDGDGNTSTDEVSYPARFEESIAVGAIDQQKRLTNFSNTNDRLDVVALGDKVKSTWLRGEYATLSGTSMATPHVSGFMLLLREKFIHEFEREPSETELYAQLIKHTQKLQDVSSKGQGNGMIHYQTYQNESIEIIMNIEEKSYSVNGQIKEMDTTPIVDKNNRTLVPVRFVSETLGAKVEWMPPKTVKITK